MTPIMIKSAPKAQKFLERTLPERWLIFINQNAKSRAEASAEDKLWADLFKISFMRVFIFSFILAAIIVVVNLWVRPYALAWMPNLPARIFTTFVAMLLMSPFLTGLVGRNIIPSGSVKAVADKILGVPLIKKLGIDSAAEMGKFKVFCNKISAGKIFCSKVLDFKKQTTKEKKRIFMMPQNFRRAIRQNTDTVKDSVINVISKDRISQIYTELWFANRANRPSLLILTSVRLLIVSFFIVTAVHLFLTENPKFIFLLLLVSIWLIVHSKWLLKQYIKIENRFLDNLNGDNIDGSEE